MPVLIHTGESGRFPFRETAAFCLLRAAPPSPLEQLRDGAGCAFLQNALWPAARGRHGKPSASRVEMNGRSARPVTHPALRAVRQTREENTFLFSSRKTTAPIIGLVPACVLFSFCPPAPAPANAPRWPCGSAAPAFLRGPAGTRHRLFSFAPAARRTRPASS